MDTTARIHTAGRLSDWLPALLAGWLMVASASAALAQGSAGDLSEPGPRTVAALAATQAEPSLDGVLDDAAWASAEVATEWVQTRPDPGAPASRAAEARVLYTPQALYIGLRLYQDPDSILAPLGRRDAGGLVSDWAHVVVDSYHDRRTAFRFSVNPSGVQKDVLHFEDVREDVNWDAVWESATRVDGEGWVAELRIPLSQLRYSTRDAKDAGEAGGLVWGVNFGRELARRGEQSWWSPVLPDAGGFVSEFGELRGLRGLGTPRRVELVPYAVTGLTRAPEDAENPFYEPNDGRASAGLDLRYGLTSNLTLSATLNPDFGQVEADPSQVNLSAFETYFSEKRPFFLEGANLFEFGVGVDDGSGEGLFYSRRIGRSPQRGVNPGGGWVDSPESTTILGAAKLSGQVRGGWSIGILDAVTDREEATILSADGIESKALVEPRTNYFAASISRDFRRGGSTLGALFTATHRDLEGDEALTSFLRGSAYSVGVRGRHKFADETWEASAYVAGSHVRGSAEAIAAAQRSSARYFQRPDASHVEYDPTRTSLSGVVANAGLWKNGGGSLRGGFGAHLRTPGFEVNDLGFMNEADDAIVYTSWRWQQFEPVGPFRNFSVGVNPSAAWTLDGERTWTQLGHWANWELHNMINGGWWTGLRFDAWRDGALRGGPAIRAPGGLRYSAWLNGDRRNAVNWHAETFGGLRDESGSRDAGGYVGLTLRPSPRLNLSIGPSLRKARNTWQYLGQPTDDQGRKHYLFGTLDQTTVALTTRLDFTLTPDLSLELYAQPFISAGDYRSFREVADPAAETFEDRFLELSGDRLRREDGRYLADADGDGQTDVAFGDPDFNFKEMRGNAVLRWQWRPGSTLFLVWSQSRTSYLGGGAGGVGFEADRDIGRLFNRDDEFPTPVTNVFLVKASYWISL